MSKRKRDLTSEERSLWRRAAADVRPRRPAALDDPIAAPAPAKAPMRAAVAKRPPPPGAAAAPKSPPADRGAEKRVRRGKLEIGATLDPHGFTQDGARAALSRFLHGAHRRGDQTVIVITGVGRAGEGVLRRALPQWLAERELRPLVAGFAQAHRSHGGAGAYYVFLKRRKDEPR